MSLDGGKLSEGKGFDVVATREKEKMEAAV